MKQHVYILRMRPPGPGCQPIDGLVKVTTEPIPFNGRQSWGTAVYNRMLSEEEQRRFELDYLGTLEE